MRLGGDPTPTPKVSYPKEAYKFLGANADEFFSHGWRPVQSSDSQIVYRNTNNNAMRTPDGSEVLAVSKPDGSFDIILRDKTGKVIPEPLQRNLRYEDVRKFITGAEGARTAEVREQYKPKVVDAGSLGVVLKGM